MNGHTVRRVFSGIGWGVITLSGCLLAIFSLVVDLLPAGDVRIQVPEIIQIAGVVAGLIIFYSGLLILKASGRYSNAATNILILSTTLLTMLVIAEGISRLIFPQPRFDPRLPYYPFTQRTFAVDLQGVSPLIKQTTNEWGFRGDPPPEDWEAAYTIIAIGGSTTQSYYIDDQKTWPALLQDGLREYDQSVWINNAGLDGQTTRGHLVVMEEVIRELRPDAVIILAGINDLGLSLSEERRMNGSEFDEKEAPFLFQFQLFRLAWMVKGLVLGQAVLPQRAHRNFEAYPVNEDTLDELPEDLVTILPSLPEYRENLNQIIDIANDLDIEVVLLTQPLLFSDSVEWESILGTTYWLENERYTISAATYWKLLNLYNQTLLDVCSERDVNCFDLASHIPHNQTYFYDMAHFNEAGSELVAKELTDYLSK